AAVGRPEMGRGHWIKPGATVIDIGVNRIAGEAGKSRIVGDVAVEEARPGAGAIPPGPGGGGPMRDARPLAHPGRGGAAPPGLPPPDFNRQKSEEWARE